MAPARHEPCRIGAKASKMSGVCRSSSVLLHYFSIEKWWGWRSRKMFRERSFVSSSTNTGSGWWK
jgi:hypothetical protein